MSEQFTTYKVKLDLLSSVVTPFQADTIFGTICWGIVLTEGESRIKEFLSLYKNRETVPLVTSDGFFAGYLPKPLCEPLSLKKSEKLIGQIDPALKAEEKIKYLDEIKKFRNLRYLPRDYIEGNKDSLSQSKMLKDFLCGTIKHKDDTLVETVPVIRTSINRYNNKAMEGRLFHTDETFYASGIDIYVKLNKNTDFDLEWLKKIFRYIEVSGYGADKSTGKGQVRFEVVNSDLPQSTGPNAFISLSSFIPEKNDPSDGYYEPLLKYGKLGGHYATSPINKTLPGSTEKIGHNPFKRPLLMFRSGSTFKLDQGKCIKDYYGKIVDNVHWDESIVHYALAFPLGVRLES